MAVKSVNPQQRRRPLCHREEGQAALEFLLILPAFLLFFLLVVDFGIMMYQYVSVSNAVREGARYGAINCRPTSVPPGTCTSSLVQQRVIDRSGGILTSLGDVTVGWVDNNNPPDPANNHDRGDSVVVKVNHPYGFLFSVGPAVRIVSCADMSLEQKDNGTGLLSGTRCQ